MYIMEKLKILRKRNLLKKYILRFYLSLMRVLFPRIVPFPVNFQKKIQMQVQVRQRYFQVLKWDSTLLKQLEIMSMLQ